MNRRFVYMMRSLGKGHSGAKKFCALVNMPPPLSQKAYWKTSRTIKDNIKTFAKHSMADAAHEMRMSKSGENGMK